MIFEVDSPVSNAYWMTGSPWVEIYRTWWASSCLSPNHGRKTDFGSISFYDIQFKIARSSHTWMSYWDSKISETRLTIKARQRCRHRLKTVSRVKLLHYEYSQSLHQPATRQNTQMLKEMELSPRICYQQAMPIWQFCWIPCNSFHTNRLETSHGHRPPTETPK